MRSTSIRIVSTFCLVAGTGLGSAHAQQDRSARGFDGFGEPSSTRVIVRLKDEAFRAANVARANAAAEANVLPRLSARFRTTASAWRPTRMRRAFAPAFAHPALAERHGLDRMYTIEVPRGTDTVALAAALETLADEVEFATPDSIGGVAGGPPLPNDTNFAVQWNMYNFGQTIQTVSGFVDADIDGPEAWEIHSGNFGTVTVAVLDSGVSSHPEIGVNDGAASTGRFVPGYNTCEDSAEGLDLQDGCPHGTHVAGIIAAEGNNGMGVAGVTWGANIMPVRVLFTRPDLPLGDPCQGNPCSGSSSDLSEGIVWAADHGADVINMSLQYPGISPSGIIELQSAVDYAHDLGVLLVGAAGNNSSCGFGVVCYPGKAVNVVGVSATDNRDQFWFVSGTGSNFGAEIDVSAPGKDVWSTWTNGTYRFLSGTSMATPHVAGLGALVMSYVPSFSADQVAEILMTTAEDRGDLGWDEKFGFGRINAQYALKAAAVWPGIIASDPPDGAIDARAPLDATGTIPVGWSEIEVTFAGEVSTVASEDFALEQTTAGAAPAVILVEPLSTDRVRVVLDRPIDPLGWTTIVHVHTGTRIRLGYLPGDVDGDRTSAPADILALIDWLNGVGPPLAIWQTDIDRSALAAPPDILEEVDLLNGAVPYDPYLGATLPPMP